MSYKVLTGMDLLRMIEFGATLLDRYAEEINDLNVFPVPDGDTGTNMSLTMRSGYEASLSVSSNNLKEILPAFSRGLLMGARGNSGVILSQIFAGFSEVLKSKKSVKPNEFALALKEGSRYAYEAVTDPVEGTILTVVRETAELAEELAEQYVNFEKYLGKVIEAANDSLNRTPEALAILREVGVVDSGGKGLVVILEGFQKALLNESIDEYNFVIDKNKTVSKAIQGCIPSEEITYGYCTEFMIQLANSEKPFKEDDLRKQLGQEGDSLVVVKNADLVKVHLHTEYPGKSLNLAQEYGSLNNIKIENMRDQHAEIVDTEINEYGIIAVSSGEGNAALFKELGVAEIIEGGQTMNPSIQTFVDAISKVSAENIIILPNNKNIFLAAQEAGKLAARKVTVLATYSIPQGLSAMLAFDESLAIDENAEQMEETLKHITDGQITRAIRPTTVTGLEIVKNDLIGITNGEIVAANKDERETLRGLLHIMATDDSEIITVLIGKDAILTEEEILKTIENELPEIEVEIHKGGQVVYSYLISVE